MAGKVMKTVVSLAGAIDPSLAKAIQKAEKDFAGMGKVVEKVNKSLLAFGAASVTAAGAMTGYLIKSGNDYIRTMNDISAQTGLTGESLEEFTSIARDVYKTGVGESFQEISDAMINIKQASGLVGEELEAATKNGLMLKDTFEFEVNESTRAASALMKNFGISADEAYGLIAKGAQNGANKNGDLLDTLNEYSVHYKALGLDADQFVTSLIAGAEAGSFSIDKVGDAVKEFTIRSKDGSDSSMEAFEAIGLNARTMTAAFSMGGEEAEAAFFKTIEALNAMEDPMAKNAAGVALFGTMFEDLEAGVLTTLGNMNGASIDAVDTLRQTEKVKYNDAGYALTRMWRTIQDGLLPAAERIGQAIFEVMPDITESVEGLLPSIIALTDSFAVMLPSVIEIFGGLIRSAAPIISQLLTQLTPFISDVFMQFVEIIAIIGPQLMQLVSTILPVLASILSTLIPQFMQILQAILPPIIELITALAPIIGFLANMIGVVLVQAINVVMPIVQSLIGIFTHLADFITNVFTLQWGEAFKNIVKIAGNIFGGLVNIIFTPLNIIIGLINSVIEGFNMIQLPDWVPGVGGKGINIPLIPMLSLPKFAEGGFTNGISIAGEEGMEAVISFDKAHRADNIGIWEKAGQLLGVSSGNSSIDIGGLTINFEVNGSSSPQDVVREIKNNIHDIVDELVEELDRRTAGSYSVNTYIG